MHYDTSDSDNPRGCYCGLWKTNPDFLREQQCAEGFCGNCERCGAPGHTRHFPGPLPRTGAWCDRCYRIVAWNWPLTHPVFLLKIAIGIALLVSLYANLR
jgi:hypothetical protein